MCIPFLVKNCTFKTHSAGGIRVHEEAAMDDNSCHCFRKGAGYFARIGGRAILGFVTTTLLQSRRKLVTGHHVFINDQWWLLVFVDFGAVSSLMFWTPVNRTSFPLCTRFRKAFQVIGLSNKTKHRRSFLAHNLPSGLISGHLASLLICIWSCLQRTQNRHRTRVFLT